MITVNGKQHNTIGDDVVRERFDYVTPKTIQGYINTGVIPEPPTVDYGTRTIQVFPTNYLDKAEKKYIAYKDKKKKSAEQKKKQSQRKEK